MEDEKTLKEVIEGFKSDLQSDEMTAYGLFDVYSRLSDIVKSHPELADEVFETFQLALQFYENNGDTLVDAYLRLSEIVKAQPQLADKVVESFHIGLQSYENNQESLYTAYPYISEIIIAHPKLADKGFEAFQAGLQSYENGRASLKNAYFALFQLAKEHPDLSEKCLETFIITMESQYNDWGSITTAHSYLSSMVKLKPELAEKVFEIFQQSLQSDDCDGYKIRNIYSCLSKILDEQPQLADKVLETLQVGLYFAENDSASLQKLCQGVSAVLQAQPKLEDDVFKTYQALIQSEQNDQDSLDCMYNILSETMLAHPDLEDKCFEVYQIAIQSDKNNWWSMHKAYQYLNNVLKEKPQLSEKVLEIYELGLLSDKIDVNNIGEIYNGLTNVLRTQPHLADKGFELYQQLIQLDKNNNSSLGSAYIGLSIIVNEQPELADKVFATFQAGLQSDENRWNSIETAYRSLSDIVRTQPHLADKVFETYQMSIQSDTINNYALYQLYLNLSRIAIDRPELANKVFEFVQMAVRSANNDFESTLDTYDSLYRIIIERPELADKGFETFQITIQSDNHTWHSLRNAYTILSDIVHVQPQLVDKALETFQIAMQSDKNCEDSLKDAYTSLSSIVQKQPQSADKAFELLQMGINSDKNGKHSIEKAYYSIADILSAKPQLANKAFDVFKQAMQSDKNDEYTLRTAYMRLSDMIQNNPQLAERVLIEINIDTNLRATAYNLISKIIENRADLIPQIVEKYPDIKIDTLQSASKILSHLSVNNGNILFSTYEKLSTLSAENQKKIEMVLTTKQFETEDKQLLHNMLVEDKLPIKDIAEFNPKVYKEVKEYMLSKECEAYPELSKEEVYELNKEWLTESAIYAAVLYKKDYKRYFDVVEKYNKELPRLKSLMPEVHKEVAEKTTELTTKLESVQQERRKYDTREHGIGPRNIRYKKMRAKYDELGVVERGINGNLQGVLGYIDYAELQPISMEKATAWMKHAVKVKDREGLLKKINGALLSTNPNILACGNSGQPFIRLDYKTAIQSESTDEIMLISSRWDTIPIEVKVKGFKEIVDAAKSYKFNGKNVEFMQANAKYIVNQKTYDEAEAIYEQGQLTPSRFERKEHYSKDGSWRCYIADKDDPRPLYAGGMWSDRAKCCQSYGDAGSTCAVDSVLNPDSGCVIFERKTIVKDENGNEKEVWEMQGCSWCYEVQSGEYKKLIFDNVEINDGCKAELKAVNEAFDSLVEDLSKENYLEIRMGYSPDLGLRGDESAYGRDDLPHGYSGYSDASRQYILKRNEEATQEKLPEIMIVGMDLSKHRQGMEKVAQVVFPNGDRELEIPDNAKGMVLTNRNNEVLGYVIWTEKEDEEHKGEVVKNWIYDMAVLPKHQGQSGSLKLLTEMMKHVQKTGGTWGGELRDGTSLKYLTIMSDRVENAELAGIDPEYRGRAKVDLEIVKLERAMQDGSKVYRCIFKPLSQEETEQRLNARKVGQSLSQTRGKLISKHEQKETSQKETTVSSTPSSGITKPDYGHDNR